MWDADSRGADEIRRPRGKRDPRSVRRRRSRVLAAAGGGRSFGARVETSRRMRRALSRGRSRAFAVGRCGPHRAVGAHPRPTATHVAAQRAARRRRLGAAPASPTALSYTRRFVCRRPTVRIVNWHHARHIKRRIASWLSPARTRSETSGGREESSVSSRAAARNSTQPWCRQHILHGAQKNRSRG